MSFARYKQYKDSDVQWLGRIPCTWSVKRIRHLFEIRKRICGSEGDEVLSITQQGIKLKDTESGDGQLSADYSKYQFVEVGDFAMNHMDLLTGYVDISPFHGVTSPDYRVFAIRDRTVCFDKYFLYLFQAGYRNRIFFAYGQGSSQLGRWRLPTDQFTSFELPCPPFEEQQQIAAFLDREMAKIDELVCEQENLLRLLKEKRLAVISHTVTKGRAPHVPMKHSEISWLGDIPNHWERVQLGKVCLQVSDGPHFSPSYVEDGVLFISARNLKSDGWALDDGKFISEADYAEFCKRVIPEKGDILYTKGGTTGVARVVDFEGRFQVWVHVAVLKIDKGMADPYFVAYSLNGNACYEQSQLYTRGATNNDLGLTRMIKMWLALPPLPEQKSIVDYLDRETARIDALSREAESAIALLQERRSALILAAVTGKIDVRGLLSTQPEKDVA